MPLSISLITKHYETVDLHNPRVIRLLHNLFSGIVNMWLWPCRLWHLWRIYQLSICHLPDMQCNQVWAKREFLCSSTFLKRYPTAVEPISKSSSQHMLQSPGSRLGAKVTLNSIIHPSFHPSQLKARIEL